MQEVQACAMWRRRQNVLEVGLCLAYKGGVRVLQWLGTRNLP
jgi:hypothetical protein